MRTRSLAILLILIHAFLLSIASSWAAPVAVRFKEGSLHGFLVLSTLDGTRIAEGDLIQAPQGDRITSRLEFRFKDGSRQEETTVFSQRGYFRLISYHMVQKGPAFQHDSDIAITPAKGQATVRYTDKDGSEKTESERLELPQDLANGLVPLLMKNLAAEALPTEVSMVVATPKPRLVKLAISAQGKATFSLAGSSREAVDYAIKVDIGGLAGLVAPVIGKQPPEMHVWVLGGDSPTVVKSETLSYMNGPMWRTELVAPVWAAEGTAESKKASVEKH